MPKTPCRRLTYKERVQIHTLADIGWKAPAIALKLGIPQLTVYLCLKTPHTPQKPQGRAPLLNTPLRHLLVRHATKNSEQRRKSREEIAHELGINVCRRTLIKAFEKELYHRRKATEKPLLTPQHIEDRLHWAWEHLNWTDEQWASVGWSDEMSIRVSHGQVYVTRRAEERYLVDCCVPKFKKYAACMVWSIISLNIKGPLVIFEKEWCTNKKKTVNSKVYIQHILPFVRAFQETYKAGTSKELIFMEDNASIHTSKATKAAERMLGINKIWWPANSPDLNPIENVWRLLKYRVEKRFPLKGLSLKISLIDIL